MKTQATAAQQLSAYFLQPVEFARVLAAERLGDRLEPADRPKVVERIVQSITPVVGDAKPLSSPGDEQAK